MVAPTDLYDKFLANLKQNLSIHKRQISVEKYSQKSPKKKLQSIPMLTEGPSVSDIIGDISEYDQDLIAAYVCAQHMFSQIPNYLLKTNV